MVLLEEPVLYLLGDPYAWPEGEGIDVIQTVDAPLRSYSEMIEKLFELLDGQRVKDLIGMAILQIYSSAVPVFWVTSS